MSINAIIAILCLGCTKISELSTCGSTYCNETDSVGKQEKNNKCLIANKPNSYFSQQQKIYVGKTRLFASRAAC